MVVQQRTELGRIRLLYFLSIILATTSLVAVFLLYPQADDSVRMGLAVLGGVALVALVLALLLVYTHPRRSHALLVHRGSEMIVATNALHEGFKLRFLRDVLSENVEVLSDEERARWKFLEGDGYYPALCIRNSRKLLVLRLCCMLFDDVYAVDASQRWEHHDSASTAEPAFATADKPSIRSFAEFERTWKGLDA
jgi:hypothetical protein